MNKGHQKISEVDLILSKQLKRCPWLSDGRRWTIVSCSLRFSAARPTWLGAQSWRIHGAYTVAVTCIVFVLLVFTARLQAVLLAMDICKMLCGREAP